MHLVKVSMLNHRDELLDWELTCLMKEEPSSLDGLHKAIWDKLMEDFVDVSANNKVKIPFATCPFLS